MLCEICGKEFKGKGFKILVEGAELTVCYSCQKFGTSPGSRSRVPRGAPPQQRGTGPAQRPRSPSPQQKARSLELVEDYNDIVKNKREEMGLSQADLGKRISEKESLIHRVETKSIRPTNKVARKLEKELDVTLLESVGDVEVESKTSINKGLTISDIIKFKK
ncbi:MAG TPA: TIGR00270 family protein [Methanomicrobia archaeon]|nr:TIGR00270 family protein [Methanomicrobia archaeon]